MGKICDGAFGLSVFSLILHSTQFCTELDTGILTINVHYVFKSSIARFCTAVALTFRGWEQTEECGGAGSGLPMKERGESWFTKEMPYRKSASVFQLERFKLC